MKNKNNNKISEFFSSRGFYTALFTCIFAILAVAAFVSIRNIDALTRLTTYEDEASGTAEALQAAAQTDTPISELIAERLEKQQAEQNFNDAKRQIDKEVKKLESENAKLDAQKAEDKTAEPKEEPKERGETTSEAAGTSEQGADKADKADKADGQDKEGQAASDKKPDSEGEAEGKNEPHGESASVEIFPDNYDNYTAYDGGGMSWPLDGAIVMDFNNTSAIVYDKTLDQYRTNPTVSISSEVGTQVKAAADGVVKSIEIDPRMGHTVVLEHGNGWETIYQQLQETILVSEGEAVSRGQAIGGVGSPTRFGVLLGPHLVFGVEKDGAPQNPTAVLADANN